MSVNQIPTLILGIGGIGCKIAATISDSLSDRDRKYISVIGIDTNVNDLALLKDKHKMETIQTSEPIRVNDYLEKHPEYEEWFPTNNFLRERTMTDGAGQIRTLSRMACLSAIENGRFSVILSEIDRIRRLDENPMSNRLTVMFVGSITGGTGAGLFLQLPFYVRDLVKKQIGIDHFVIRGMFVGPDVTEPLNPSTTNRDAVCVNGYTCLKELNAFNLRPVYKDSMPDNLRVEYFDHTDGSVQNVPYNYLYLLEKSSSRGSAGDIKVEEIINYAAHIVYTLLFSPVKNDALSIEDNFILASIGKGGLNKYTAAGMCRLVYPQETVQKYVTMNVVKQLVQNEWMLIDRSFEAIKRAALAKQRTDSTVEIPKLKTSYVEIFERESRGDRAKLGAMGKEAYIEKDNGFVPRSNDFLQGLNDMIDELLDSDEVRSMEESCKVNKQKMKAFSDAEGQINEVWEAMRSYVKLAKHLIATKPGSYADDLFPQNVEVMEFHKDKKECIYSLLAGVHPVTARFFIYDIINKLEKMAHETKLEITGVNLSAYTDEDFDKRPGKQGPSEALNILRESRNPIWKMLGPVGEAINSEEKVLQKLRKKLDDVTETHVQTIHSYIENSIKYNVAVTLLERLNALAENYAVFFNTVAAKIDRNNESMTRLENIYFPFGKEGVYCTKTALQKIADSYTEKNVMELSEDTKKAIFDQIFFVQSRAFSSANSRETPAEKEMRSQKAQRDLERIFNTAVVDTVSAEVVEKGAGIVNLTIREALFKEYELNTGAQPMDPDYTKGAAEYIRNRISTAMRMAEPMLATEVVPEKAEICFMALSPACAETDENLNPAVAQTKHFYLPSTDGSTTVMIHDEFPDNEITCLRVAYNYLIEHLVKYQKGSRNEKAYRDRILNLGMGDISSTRDDDQLITVNPHLNCYWHEEGFIPDISRKQWEKDKRDVLKAFIYALGLDCFKLINDDEHPDDDGKPRPTWFSYTNGYTQVQPIKKCGKNIGNGFSDVYDALFYNGMLKLSILRDAKREMEKMKGYQTTEELFEEILSNDFIDDLIQPASAGTMGNGNIFDIFLIMRSHMPEKDWKKLFEGLIETLWEFCGYLFDNSEVYVNKAIRLILEKIYENCTVSKKPQEEKKFGDRMLDEQYSTLLKMKYEAKR